MGKEITIENMSTDDLINTLYLCASSVSRCRKCLLWENNDCMQPLKEAAADRLKQLQQELIDERHRYDRLVDFELAEAAELAKFKANTQNVVIVQFCEGSKKYLYALPKRSKVRKGMELTVNTGDICHACCDSFLVGGAALDALVELAGAKLPLTFVSGVVLKLTPDE